MNHTIASVQCSYPEGYGWVHQVNSLSLERCNNNFQNSFFNFIIQNCKRYTYCEVALRWIPQNLMYEKSALVLVMAWCHQAASHYLNQYCPTLCCHVASLGANGLTKNYDHNKTKLSSMIAYFMVYDICINTYTLYINIYSYHALDLSWYIYDILMAEPKTVASSLLMYWKYDNLPSYCNISFQTIIWQMKQHSEVCRCYHTLLRGSLWLLPNTHH